MGFVLGLARVAAAGGIALCLPALATLAQTAPPPLTVDTTNSTKLSAEKQKRIREFVGQQARIRGTDPLKTEDGAFSPGMTIPSSVALNGLPEDRATEVPQVTSYQFFLASNGIVVVDPATRVVVQVIPGG